MRTFQFVLSVVLSTNGLWMLLAPQLWFSTVPGVVETGAFNPHFVRDIGAAYLASGLAFGAVACWGRRMIPAAGWACAFLLLHGAIHIADTALGHRAAWDLMRDAPLVVALPLLGCWSLRNTREGVSHA